MAACGWKRVDPRRTSFRAPTCEDCDAYKRALVRMGRVRG